MPPEVILETLRQRPFRAFRLHVTDGAFYDVRHPEMVLPGRRFLVVGIIDGPGQDNGQPVVADRYATVAHIHITRLEPLEGGAAS